MFSLRRSNLELCLDEQRKGNWLEVSWDLTVGRRRLSGDANRTVRPNPEGVPG